jgi:hypothetical protein
MEGKTEGIDFNEGLEILRGVTVLLPVETTSKRIIGDLLLEDEFFFPKSV